MEWVVLGALVLVAIHVVDDALVQRPAGTSVGDHLWSGLIPVAVLGVAGALLRRLRRPSARAWIALTSGLWGIVAGGMETVAHLQNDSAFGGDDYTGALSVLAGLVLIGACVWISWSERRRAGGWLGRLVRRGAMGALVVASAFVVTFPPTISYYATHTSGAGLVNDPEIWVPMEKVSLRTSDGLRLTGWHARSRNGAAVIVVSGRSGRKHGAMLARHGYGVLLLNRRGEGDSEGDPNLFGWGGDRDISAAASFLADQPDVDPDAIAGLGLSVGGEMMLQHAAENDILAAVISEGAGSRSIRESLELTGGIRAAELSTAPLMTSSLVVLSNQMPPPNLMSLLRAMPAKPVMVIWGERGQPAEIELSRGYAEAAQGSEPWQVPDAGHTRGLTAQPELYERRVIDFLDRALLQD